MLIGLKFYVFLSGLISHVCVAAWLILGLSVISDELTQLLPGLLLRVLALLVLLLACVEIHRLPPSVLVLSKEASQPADFLRFDVLEGLQAVELVVDSVQGVQGEVSLGEATLIIDYQLRLTRDGAGGVLAGDQYTQHVLELLE